MGLTSPDVQTKIGFLVMMQKTSTTKISANLYLQGWSTWQQLPKPAPPAAMGTISDFAFFASPGFLQGRPNCHLYFFFYFPDNFDANCWMWDASNSFF